jgi:hypothetical protein
MAGSFTTASPGQIPKAISCAARGLEGIGTVMLADPDAYDDGTNVDERLFNVNILTPVIPLTGVVANSVQIAFDSSFRAEEPEIATLDVTFDGVTFVNLLTFDGNLLPDGALFNDPVAINVDNPSAGSMRFRWHEQREQRLVVGRG